MAIFIIIIKYEDNGMNIDKTVFPRRNSQIYLCLWLYMDTINRENIISISLLIQVIRQHQAPNVKKITISDLV
jgi:hypothetical protein